MEAEGTARSPRGPRAEYDWPRMDTPNVLWFFATFAIAFATIALIDKIPETHRDVWELLVAVAFCVAYSAVGFVLLRRDWWIPGSLLVATAVAVMPAVGYGVGSLVGTFPNDPFADPFVDGSWTVFLIGIATIVAALVSFTLTRFSFILFELVIAASVTAQLLLATVTDHPSADAHLVTAIVVGVALVAVGIVLDVARRRRDAFWFHAGGFLGVAIGLAYYTTGAGGDADRGWIPMFLAGALVLVLSAPLRRATWAVFGVLGFYTPLFHWLTNNLNADSAGYALLLLAIGLSIFVLGLLLHGYGRIWTEDQRRAIAPRDDPKLT
jgi:hypothetical protein